MNKLEKVESKYLKKDLPDFRPGDKVKLDIQISEENKDRIQSFEGIVIKKQGSGLNETFTVRKKSFNVGVERTFLIHSPNIKSIKILGSGIVKRAKLYFLREKIGKKSKIRFKK